MRIAVVHSFYSSHQPSGENRVVEHQVVALQRAGHSVALVDQRTDQRERRRTYPLAAVLTVATGRGPDPLRELRDFQPEIVHVHNLFPNYGRTWVDRWDGPIVATMHNYRPMCAAATLYRDEHACTDCLDSRSPRPGVRHGCYRGSRVATLPVAVGVRFGSDPLLRRADCVVTITSTMRDLYERAGVSGDRLCTVPNFIPSAAGQQPPTVGPDYWLYVGRLSPEKGILELVRDWPASHRLLVVGAGKAAELVAASAPPSVELLGEQTPEVVSAMMAGAQGLVFPSRSYEGLALVCLEALSVGTPILAWAPSDAAHSVQQLGIGDVVGAGLEQALDQAARRFPTLRAQCLKVYEERFTESAWLSAIGNVYHRVMA